MKLSDRFNSNSVACVVSLRDLVAFDDIDIPDVQRGLVWNPTQIVNLWKSIFAGYPIGALTLYKQEEKWQLIDGQQRWHSIKLGLLKPAIETAMTMLWVNADNLELMVCTRRHPWGFRWNEDKLEKLPHGKMIGVWQEMLPRGDNSFIIPDMEKASVYWVEKGMIPLYRILARDNYFSVPEPVWQKTKEWRNFVDAPSLPLMCFDLKQGEYRERNRIQELFTRINKGGTPISSTDLTYSTLCSYMGSDFPLFLLAAGGCPYAQNREWFAQVAGHDAG